MKSSARSTSNKHHSRKQKKKAKEVNRNKVGIRDSFSASVLCSSALLLFLVTESQSNWQRAVPFLFGTEVAQKP